MPFSLISSVIASRSISHPGRCISDNLIPQHSGMSFGHTVTIKVSPCSNLAAKACLLLLLFYWAFYKGTCMVSLELLRCDTPHDMLGFNIYLVLLTSVMTVLMIIRLHVTLVKFCSATLAFLLPCISVECFSTLALVRDFWAYLCKICVERFSAMPNIELVRDFIIWEVKFTFVKWCCLCCVNTQLVASIVCHGVIQKWPGQLLCWTVFIALHVSSLFL